MTVGGESLFPKCCCIFQVTTLAGVKGREVLFSGKIFRAEYKGPLGKPLSLDEPPLEKINLCPTHPHTPKAPRPAQKQPPRISDLKGA